MRKFNRKNHELRKVSIEQNFNVNAHGSCLISMGNTKVICTATFDEDLPPWLKNKESGWVTAEYGMLPGSTSSRNKRESKQGKQNGRTVEIQRLIGRSLRTIVDLKKIKGYQFIIDCDVIQADGGTRTASINGGFVAMACAIKKLMKIGKLKEEPIKDFLAAVSCGIINNETLLDLDYHEDSNADTDANFVLAEKKGISEIQVSAEKNPFSLSNFNEMIELSMAASKELFKIQKKAIEKS